MITLAELRDAADKAFPADALRPARDAGWALIAEMGWLMVCLPEDDGGLGLGLDTAAVLAGALGRVLAGAPLVPALLGLDAIVAANGLADRAGWIERICGGAYIPLNLLSGRVEAGANGALTGVIGGVFEADMASHIVAGFGGAYRLIPLDAPGVAVIERSIWDESRRLFDIALTDYQPDPALLLADGEAARPMHDHLAPRAHLALAADSLAGAQAALTMSVEYLQGRRQFDRPLAMFQALKHRCADLKVRIAAADALLWARAADPAPVPTGAMKALACEVYSAVTEEAVQFHGGIGLTQEHHCHLFLKRAALNAQLCGSADTLNAAAGRAALAT